MEAVKLLFRNFRSGAKLLSAGELVDLKGFEPLTSSMPFKKYQSLADTLAKNRGLTGCRFGRHLDARPAFGYCGLHSDSRLSIWKPSSQLRSPMAISSSTQDLKWK